MSTVMIVDDDREMGRLLKTLFELEGYQVVVVRSYNEILETLHETRPDMVLMDVRVQGRETIELARAIRQNSELGQIPMVMTSGMDLRQECMDAGADFFVLKPFLPDDLVQRVGGLLEDSLR